MQITLTKEQVKEAFGELRFMGADNCYHYDKDSKKKTEEVEALKLHLGRHENWEQRGYSFGSNGTSED